MASLIFGRSTVRESLTNPRVKNIYVSSSFSDKALLDIAEKEGVLVHIVSSQKLDAMVSGNHQGIVAEIERFEYSSIDEIIRFSKTVERPVILLLDGINDPGNFGGC